jgi:predicted DNA-binding protein with PD1-like motif
MQAKLVSKPGETRIWFAVLAPGEEAIATLSGFAEREHIKAASFVALGAFEGAVLAYFDWEKKKYIPIPVDHQVEVITLVGDMIEDEKGKTSLHAHAVLGLPDGTTRGGHLQAAAVRPTLEVTVTETPAHLVRRKHDDLGLSLIAIE